MINQKDSDRMNVVFGHGDLLQSVAVAPVKAGEPMWWLNEHTKGAVGQILNMSTADLLPTARITMSFGTVQSLDVLINHLLSVRRIQFPKADPLALPTPQEAAKAPPATKDGPKPPPSAPAPPTPPALPKPSPFNPMHRRDQERTDETIG